MPKSLTTTIISYFHKSPLGLLKTLLKILEVAWWPEVCKDIWKYVKECMVCQKYKPSYPVPSGDESRGAWVHVRGGPYGAPSQR